MGDTWDEPLNIHISSGEKQHKVLQEGHWSPGASNHQEMGTQADLVSLE